MHHLLLDLAKIGLIIVAAAIAVSAFIGTTGTSYDPYSDELYYVPRDEDDEI